MLPPALAMDLSIPMPCRLICGSAAFASPRSGSWTRRSCGATRTLPRVSEAISAASRTTTWSTENFPKTASTSRTPGLGCASTETGRGLTSSAITSSTSWEPAAQTNLNITNGAVVPRLRLYWVDARKGGWEFLAGQSWSMLTPNRVGISPLPGDIFYSQVMDVNYMAGLTWTRQPGIRVLYHARRQSDIRLLG